MKILHATVVAAVLAAGSVAAQAEELRLGDSQLDQVSAGIVALPSIGGLGGLLELGGGLLDLPDLGLPSEVPDLGLPPEEPGFELPPTGGLDLSFILGLIRGSNLGDMLGNNVM